MTTLYTVGKKIKRFIGQGMADHSIRIMPTYKSMENSFNGPGEPSPLFSSREEAVYFKLKNDNYDLWDILELELKD